MRKLLSVVLCLIMLITMIGCSKYEVEPAFHRATYNSSLKNFVRNDNELLSNFIHGGTFDDAKGIVSVCCNDYKLTRGIGMAGTADIAAGVFYEQGLIEYDMESLQNYDRFRNDYVFEIAAVKGNECYWFVSYDDAEEWLNDNFG